jgi:hypothetical protein
MSANTSGIRTRRTGSRTGLRVKECIINKSIDMKDRYILDRTNGGVDQSIEVERVSESWTKIRDEQ